ncbi:MAG: sunset domain-containing protein [Enterococcus faecalis]
MSVVLGLLGLLGLLVSGGLTIKALIKKQPKKQYGYAALASAALFIGGVATTDSSPTLSLDAESVETDANGSATIKGEYDGNSKLTANGKEVKTKDKTFAYKVKLSDEKTQKITFVAEKKDTKVEKSVEVTPSKEFIASITDSEQELAKTEKALAYAEKQPSQKNYDEAATLVSSLSQEYEEYNDRLEKIKKAVSVDEAVTTAEKSKSKSDYQAAEKLVAAAPVGKEGFQQRLTTVQTAIAEKEKNEQLVASATAAVEKAEQEPTNEAYYNEAIKQIDALNSPNQALTKRVAVVKTQLDAHKEKQRKEAEAQKLAAEKAQKEQAEAAAKAQAEAEAQQAAQAPAEVETAAAEAPSGNALIKGSRNGIYHVPGSRYYNRTTNPVAWFSTVEEAEAAGYRAPKQ